MLLTIKLKLKRKWHLVHRLALLFAMKSRINREFGMVTGFLIKKMSFLMSQNFDSRMRQALN